MRNVGHPKHRSVLAARSRRRRPASPRSSERRRRNASFPGTSLSPATLLTQVIVLPAPVVAGWLVQRHGYGAAFSLAAGFMAVGALVILPVRLYRGVGQPPA